MKIFLINLKRATERLLSCEEEFRKAGLDFSIIEAIDGKELKLPHDKFASIKYSLFHGKKSNLGELGCYLSHLKVLKTFIKSEEKYALVCEDDIKIDIKIKEIVEKALNSDIKFDLLRLSGGSNPLIEKGIPVKLRQLTDKYHLALNFGFKSGTGSYLINRKGAEAILKKLEVMSLPIDHAIDRDWLLNIRSLCISPSPILLKEELHLKNSFINATKSYKLNPLIRYWTMVPYRFVNELIRIFYKIFIWVKIKIED